MRGNVNRKRYLIWLVTGLGWVWTLVVGGGGVVLLITRGIWPPTNGWFAMLSGLAACPLFARPLEKRLGIKFLSVAIQPDIEGNDAHNHIIQIVTGISDCETVGWNQIRASDWANLSIDRRVEFVSDRIRSLVGVVERQCKASGVGPIPTHELRRLFPAPSALAHDH